LIWW